MIKYYLIIFLVVLLGACGMQSKLNRNFTGEIIETAYTFFEDVPSTKIPMNNGNTKVIFTKEQRLPGTVINQGEKTLDPIKTPPVTKIEQFIFIVDPNGVIINSEYDSSYQKL